MPGRALDTDFRVACVFPVTVPVGSAVGQGLVFRTNHAVVVFIIDISLPVKAAGTINRGVCISTARWQRYRKT